MSKKILIATVKPFAPQAAAEAVALLEEKGYTVEKLEKYEGQEALRAAVADAHALIVRSDEIDAAVLEAAPSLELVIRAGAGYDNVDCETAKARNVVVMNTPGQNANAVAELALGMMIYSARNFFDGKPGTELLGKTLGLLGFGAVGRRLGALGRGMGMEVLAADPFLEASSIQEQGARPVEPAELWKESRYVSLHIPAAGDNLRSIGHEQLAAMPEGGTLVNTARKEVIDEEGLLRAFAERPDLRFVSDIAPDCAGAFAEKHAGRFYFTPKKMGAQTGEANYNAGVAAARQAMAFFEKGDVTFQVNG